MRILQEAVAAYRDLSLPWSSLSYLQYDENKDYFVIREKVDQRENVSVKEEVV